MQQFLSNYLTQNPRQPAPGQVRQLYTPGKPLNGWMTVGPWRSCSAWRFQQDCSSPSIHHSSIDMQCNHGCWPQRGLLN